MSDGKTKNYRLSEDEKRIHREAVQIRKKTDKQLIEYIEGEKENVREAVFRMKNSSNGVACALFEADGGAWKFRAVHEIAEYLKDKLADVENIAILS